MKKAEHPPAKSLGAFRGTTRDVPYVNTKLFGIGTDFNVTAAVIPPDSLVWDFENARFLSRRTGRYTGGLVDNRSEWWAGFSHMLPSGFRIVQGLLSDLTDFTIERIGSEGVPILSEDLDICIEYGNGELLGEMPGDFMLSRPTLPIPDRARIARVAGDIGEIGYLFSGGTWYHKMAELSRVYLGRELGQLNAVLDWGCGCGRILRHFLEAGLSNVYGVDIDAVNIQWLRDELGYNRVFRTDFDPPLPFQDGHFDLVYGHSVFTHLSRADHDRWLGEVFRVLRPGGFAFLTICSEFGTCITHHTDVTARPELIDQLLGEGMAVLADQSYVGVDSGRAGYYKLVSHTTEFIRREWSKDFQIRRIIRGFAEHQDLVIIRRPE